ncbi:MAG: DUF541 domain-containing protein [Verrucomicrobia bacterium]|nr:MAG: DUF541 domain-containing protein [Verrucomicrobiota bacterium]
MQITTHSILAIVYLIGAGWLGAQEIDLRRHIEVDAVGKASAPADRATWQIQIRGEAPTLADASKALDQSASSLIERIKAAGIDQSSFQLSSISSGKVFDHDSQTRIFKGYFALRSGIIELTDLSKRQKIEELLLADNALEILTVELGSIKENELKMEASLAAVAAAKEKASLLAKKAECELGVLLALREQSGPAGWAKSSDAMMARSMESATSSAQFEKVEFTTTVSVKFEIK